MDFWHFAGCAVLMLVCTIPIYMALVVIESAVKVTGITTTNLIDRTSTTNKTDQ